MDTTVTPGGEATAANLSRVFRDFAPPSTLGRYRILRELGRGGLGVVYVAYDPELDRKVAVKLLHAAGDDPDLARANTLREAKAAAAVSHPNVVNVYDVAESEHGVYIAMEYVPGVTLHQWLADHHNASLRTRIDLLIQAGRGLAAAHAAGVTHRDFKPANVMVGEDGRARVLDFGLARARPGRDAPFKLAEQPAGNDTTFGSGAGTPAFMAPEQFEAAEVGPPADQFAFCVVGWTALTGKRPFPTFKEPRLAAIRKGSVEGTDAHLPRRVRNALLRGLAYDPSQRFADMDSLLRELAHDRRRLVLATLTGAWLAGGIAFAAGTWGETEAPCDADEEVRSAWFGAARDRVAEGIAGSDLPFADTTVQRVHEEVDDWVDDWAYVYDSSCKAARRRGDIPLPRYEAIYACLEETQQQMRRRIDLLETPDVSTVRNALSLVRGVPTPQRCTDPKVLATRESAGSATDPQARALFEAIDIEAAELTAGHVQGRVEALDVLVEKARAHGGRRLEALALGNRGRAYRWAGVHDKAQDDNEVAMNLAIASGDHELASGLANAFAYGEQYEGDIDSALQWLRLARTLGGDEPSERLQRRNDIAEAEFLLDAGRAEEALVPAMRAADPGDGRGRDVVLARQIVGRVLHKLDRTDEAVDYAEQALAQIGRQYGEEHPLFAQALRFVGVFTLDAGRSAEALQLLTRAEEIDTRAGSPEAPGLVQLNAANIAECLVRLGRYDEALARLDGAERPLAGTEIPRTNRVAYATWVRGRALHGLDRLDEAEAQLRRALEVAREVGTQTTSDTTAYAMALAHVLIERGELDEADALLASRAGELDPKARRVHDLLHAMLAAVRGDAGAKATLAEAWERLQGAKRSQHLVRRVGGWAARELDLSLRPPDR